MWRWLRKPSHKVLRGPEVIERLLRGVNHNTEGLEVLDEVTQRNPKKVGLELPEDYLEREKAGLRIYLFGDFAERLREGGIEVVPLEDSGLYLRHQAIDVARSVREGSETEEYLKTVLEHKKSKMEYTPPEEVGKESLEFRIYEAAVEILNQAPTIRDVHRIWRKSNAAREAFMLQRIREQDCDCVVVGDGHAVKLMAFLPEYTYRPSPDKWEGWKL